MKKKFILFFILFFILIITLLSGCGNTVSQEEYDKVNKELKTTQKELKNIQKELNNLEAQKTQEDLVLAAAQAWAEIAFGKSSEAFIHNNNLYVNIPTGYTLSEKSIDALWTNLQSGISLYSTYYKTGPELFPYDSVTIIVLEEETKLDMMSLQFIKNPDGSFSKNASMINLSDSNRIIPFLDKALR